MLASNSANLAYWTTVEGMGALLYFTMVFRTHGSLLQIEYLARN